MDDTKPMQAKDIVEDPESVYRFVNHYVLIQDSSMRGTYTNLIEAINLMAERGWEAVSLAGNSSGYMYALCRRTDFKRKNEMREGE